MFIRFRLSRRFKNLRAQQNKTTMRAARSRRFARTTQDRVDMRQSA